MFNLQTIQSALKACSDVHGWIFTNFAHRDTLTDSLLSLNQNSISSRRWVYIIEPDKDPLKIVHSIESSILDDLSGDTVTYSGKNELIEILQKYTGKTFSVLADADITVISTVDAGFIQLLHECNIKTKTAAPLIQTTKGLLSASGIKSHERAAALLYKIVKETWDFISLKYKAEATLYEHDVLSFILDKFDTYSLVYHHEPIVAFGKNAGNPHYSVPKKNSAIAVKGDIIQLDIFAKEAHASDDNGTISTDASIYADISWVGIYDTEVPTEYEETFKVLSEARDVVYAILEEKSNQDSLLTVSGFELDFAVREILIKNGFSHGIKHRTGHGIDTACHGSGVNLDSVEFPDRRTVLNGSCFSVEPGLYFDSYGMRTEIDVYIENGKPIISGNKYSANNLLPIPQQEILRIS